jgi:two-component system alkaline phosphatase synthesis response regulator PhoP
MESLLVIEDDPILRLALTKTLRAARYEVRVAPDGIAGLEEALRSPPSLVLLDIMLPGKNGYEVCAELRAHDADLPILMLTAKGEEADKVRGLRLGADDYLVKPFGTEELLARIEALLRRSRLARATGETVVIGRLTVDFEAHAATRDGEPVEMTAHEMKLLRFFLGNEGRLLSRERILAAVWGADYFGTARTVDNFVNRLRAKVEDDAREPAHFVTVRGAGYRFHRNPVTQR